MDLNSLLEQKSEYKPMVAGNFTRQSIIKLAEETAARVGMDADYDLRNLISVNGGTIHDITLAQFRQLQQSRQLQKLQEKNILENSIYVHKDKDFDIIIRAYIPFDYMRYTLAHELGHYILHAEDKSYAKQKGNDQIEIEAHYFALGFLLPEQLFRKFYAESEDTNDLAIFLCVPTKLINIRKKLLELK
jgi:Zn-dependent peptidase ImmA (M78 family)